MFWPLQSCPSGGGGYVSGARFTSSNEVHRITIRCTKFDILATIVKTLTQVTSYEELNTLNRPSLRVAVLSRRDIQKCALTRRTSECTEKFAKVVAASRT